MHTPIVLQYQWLCSVLRGHFVYFGLPSNLDRMHAFYRETCRLWYRALNRRSQRRFSWEKFVRLLKRFPLPTASITRPRPGLLLTRANLGRSRVRENRLLGSV